MPIEPDTKDWTWVLKQPCPDCGFDASAIAGPEVADLLRECVARWEEVLARSDVAIRPEESTWSPLEYACHVRDVCAVMTGRLMLMGRHFNPMFPNWDQDATAASDDYATQKPAAVLAGLRTDALLMAEAIDHVPADGWQRTGRRSNGSLFTVQTLVQYFWHDVAHHLHDVQKVAPSNE